MRQYTNLPWVFKKILKPVPNPFIKIEHRPIRGEAGRVSEKPISLPSLNEKDKYKH